MNIVTAFATRFGRPLGLALAALLTLAAAPAARAQAPANDDPCGATVLLPNGALCTSPTTSTNVGATTTTPNGYTNPGFSLNSPAGCGQAGSPKDVWFKFTTTASGPSSFGVTVTVTGNPAGSLKLYSAASCAGPFTLLICAAAATNNSVSSRLTTGLLTANTTYYVQVSGYGSNDTTGPFTICLTDGPAVPTCGAPDSGPFTNTGNGTGTLAFTPGLNNTGPLTFIIRDNVTQTNLPTLMASTSPLALTGLIAGHDYTVTVRATCATGGQATSFFPYTFALPLSNDDPCGAVALPVNATCVPTAGNNTNATLSNITTNGMASCANRGRHDVWYTFTTAASGTGSTGVTVQVDNQSYGAGTLRVYRAAACSGGSFTLLGCSTNTATSGSGFPASPLVVNGLAPGTTYYVRVDEGGFFLSGLAGPFNICVVGAVGCAAPSLLFSGIRTATTAPIYFTAGNNNQSYTLTYTAQGGIPQTVTTTTTSYTLTGLLPGTFYTVSVVASCGGGQTSASTTITFTTPIDNDEPCGAVPIPLNAGPGCAATAYGSMAGATPTVPYGYTDPSCGLASNSADDVWFTVTTAASGPTATALELALTGTQKQIRLFSAASCAGPFTELGCSGVSAGTTAAPPLTVRGLLPNTTYFVRVANGSTISPDLFTLCAQPASTCAVPAGLAVSAANSLSFGAAFGASSYTVTYQAAGGAVQTVAPAPTVSPVALPGLVTGQTYTVTVASNCGAGQTSAPASLTFVAGGCAGRAYAALPVLETFESDWLSVCALRDVPSGYWRGNPATGGNAWRRDDDPTSAPWSGQTLGSYAPAGAQGSAHSARFHSTFANGLPPGNLDLFVDLSAAGTKRLTFDYSNGSGADSLKVLLSTDGGTTFNPLLRLGTASGFTAEVVDFAATSATAVLRFVGQATAQSQSQGNDLGLDNVRVLLAPACASPTLTTSNVLPTAATLGLTGGNGATTFTVTYQATGGPVQTISPNPAIGTVTLTGLLPNTTYTVTAVSNCAGGPSTPATVVTFTTPAQPIGNDECLSAMPLTLGQGSCPTLTLVNNATATTSTQSGCGTPHNDLWYSVTVPTNGIVEATTSAAIAPNITDTVMELYTGTCGSLTSIGCNDDIGGGNRYSHVRATGLTPGATVYVRVWAFGASTVGNFSLCVQTDATICNPPTGLTVLPTLTAPLTGLTVTFTPGSGTTNLTYQAQPSGTPITLAGASSPVSLTGLLPNTAYQVCVVNVCAGGTTSAPPTCAMGRTALPCAQATNLTLTRIGTGNTYSFAWTGATNAGGYAVSYVAAGGTPQFVTSPVSPATVTLLPGLTYTFTVATDCGFNNAAPVATLVFTAPLARRAAALSAAVGLFPNPAHDAATLTLPASLNPAGGTAELLNALGQAVGRWPLAPGSSRLEVPLAGRAAGVYTLRLRVGDEMAVKRLVVE